MDLMSYFVFSCDGDYQVQRWEYQSGVAKLYLNYYSTIEGMTGLINFNFDRTIVNRSSIDVNFTINSNGTFLTVNSDVGKQTVMQYAFLGLAGLVIILCLAGSLVREMAGVELIQVLQIIYYLHYSVGQYSQTLSSMQYLSPVSLNNLFMQYDFQNYAGFKQYQKVNFSPAYG